MYEPIAKYTDAQLSRKVAGAGYVVLGNQGIEGRWDYWAKEGEAARRIRATGANPIRYVEYIWRRGSETVGGININQHPDWLLCYPGTKTPVPAKNDRASGGYYIDMNERAARIAADQYLYKLKTVGYKGLFYDIGRRTFVNGLPHTKVGGTRINLANLRSGCSGSPVAYGRTVSEGYAALIASMKNNHGMITILNCCVPSHLTNSNWRGARTVRDVSNYFLNEATKTSVSWSAIQAQMNESQASGRVLSFQCAETPAKGLYAWARTKMWRVPVALNTGEGATSGSCSTAINQWGLWGELSNARLGTPLDSTYRRGQCESGSTTLCFFSRRYTNGVVVVNNGRYTLTSGSQIRLVGGSMPSCVYLGEVRVGNKPASAGSGRCFSAVTLSAGKYQGRVFLYRQGSPWP